MVLFMSRTFVISIKITKKVYVKIQIRSNYLTRKKYENGRIQVMYVLIVMLYTYLRSRRKS